MSSEHLTPSSDSSRENLNAKGVETGEHFVKDEAAIQRAVEYVDRNESSWVLDPAGITVEQPDNQGELIHNLGHLLESKQDGDRLLSHLDENLSHIRAQLSENVSMASGRIKIKAGFDLQSMDTKDLSRDEYNKLLTESFADQETIEDVDQPNLMLSGLLEATGAKLLRDDLADGNGAGRRVYKGVFESKPIYFVENISTSTHTNEDGTRTTRLTRSVVTETEDMAQTTLDSLSENDVNVLRSIDVDLPMMGSSAYNPETYPTRSRMAETLRLYESMNQPEENRVETAWTHYAPIGSAAYEAANQERIKDGKVKVNTIGDVTLVANIKLDDTGNVVSGHDYNPNAESMKDTELAWHRYLDSTPPEQRLLIYEGDERVYSDRDEAITRATDSGLAQFLAHEANVESSRGEPTPTEEMQALVEKGVSRDEALALMVGRGLEGNLANNDPHALAGLIHHQAAELKYDGFVDYTEEQKETIVREGRIEDAMKEMNRKAASLVPALNDSFRSTLGGKDLFVLQGNAVAINPELIDTAQEKIFDKMRWDGDSRMSQIARLDMEVRDQFIFDKIITAVRDGKKPFVPYGGSHIVTLTPALHAYFEK